jgi:endo-1,4-beta-xylanase
MFPKACIPAFIGNSPSATLKSLLLIALTLIPVSCLRSLAAGTGVDDSRPRLKDSFLAVHKDCGTSIMPMGMNDAAYQQILAQQFSLVVPDYGMYMSDLQPQRGKWNFENFDRIVDYAKTNRLKVRGHVLVYDYPEHKHGEGWTPTPKWVYQGHYSKADMIQIMYEHIETVMKRYQDSVSQWIVVNEAVGSALPGQMEDNIWLRTIGKEYVDLAFAHAHQTAPNAELLINDYGADYLGDTDCGPFKANNFYRYVKGLRQKGVPLTGVGLQFHLTAGADHPDRASIENNFARYHALGVRVYVTEMDVKIKEPVTEKELSEQAALYALVINTALSSTNCAGLSVWGYTDKYSWITTFHAFPGYTDACLFDSDLKPKKAFQSILQPGNQSLAPSR